jgi:hypothetical protein
MIVYLKSVSGCKVKVTCTYNFKLSTAYASWVFGRQQHYHKTFPGNLNVNVLGVTIVPFQVVGSVLYRGKEKPSTWQYKRYTCTVGVLLRTHTHTGLHTLTSPLNLKLGRD